MREMKDSGIIGIGRIPSDWDVVPLKSEFAFSKGLSITKDNLIDVGNSVVSYGQIHAKTCDGVHLTDDLIRFVDDSYLPMTNSIVPQYGFVFADTSEDMDGCGNAVYHGDAALLFGGYHTIVLSPYVNRDNRYLAYLFRTDGWRYQLRKQLTEVKLYSVSQSALKKTYITLPSVSEQIAIADCLDVENANIDDSIARHKAIIEKLQEYRKAVITQVVTKGLDSSVEMKDSRVSWIGCIPCHWDAIAVKRLAQIQTGSTPSKAEGNTNFDDTEGIPWIKAENLDTLEPIHETAEYLTSDGARSGRLFAPHTIYVCCIASVGKVGYSDMVCSCNQQINGISFNDDVYWKYGFYALIASSDEHNAKANVSVQKILNGSEEGKIKLPVPPSIDEQKEIAKHLDDVCCNIGEAIARQNKAIEKLEEYRKSVIYNAVTGKIDCRRNA